MNNEHFIHNSEGGIVPPILKTGAADINGSYKLFFQKITKCNPSKFSKTSETKEKTKMAFLTGTAIGDTVKLRGQTVNMTVIGVKVNVAPIPNLITCFWFNSTDLEPREWDFPERALVMVQKAV